MYELDDLLVCITDDNCRSVAETLPPRLSVSLFQCEVAVLYNLLARCVCHSYITLKFALFWKLMWGKWLRDIIELNGMAKLKFRIAVFRLFLFTYPVSPLCLFLHIPKSLFSVEGCWLQNIYRQVRALKIDASHCKVWRMFFVINVTCITCCHVCDSMHVGDNTKQLRNWIVLHQRSYMWNNSF